MANQPHPDTRCVTVRLHRDRIAALKAEATARGIAVTDLIRLAIDRELGYGEPSQTTETVGPVDSIIPPVAYGAGLTNFRAKSGNPMAAIVGAAPLIAAAALRRSAEEADEFDPEGLTRISRELGYDTTSGSTA